MDKKNVFFADEIHVRLVLSDVLKNAWLVVLAVLTVCIGIFAYQQTVHRPSYTCEATFSVSPKSTGAYMSFYTSMNTTAEMAEVFREVFTSDVLKRLIREDLGDKNLNFSVSSQVAEGTNILTVSVTADTAWQSHRVMRSLMEHYDEVSGYVFGSVVLDVIKQPRVPTSPSNPFSVRMKMVSGAALTAVLVLLAIVLLSILRPTVKTVKAAQRRLEDSPLGVLPWERRKVRKLFGKRQKRAPLITDADIGFYYTEAVVQTMHGIRHKMKKRGYKSVLVTSVAENEGKSTVSANLALALARHGHRVALVDLDLRRPSLMKILGSLFRYSVSDALQNGLPPLPQDQAGLFVFSADSATADSAKVLHSSALKRFLKELQEQVDYVVLDSAPYTAAADTGMLLDLADCCVMVVRQDWTPYRICHGIAEDLDKDRAEYLGYVFNCYRENSFLSAGTDHYEKYSYYGRYGAEVTP